MNKLLPQMVYKPIIVLVMQRIDIRFTLVIVLKMEHLLLAKYMKYCCLMAKKVFRHTINVGKTSSGSHMMNVY